MDTKSKKTIKIVDPRGVKNELVKFDKIPIRTYSKSSPPLLRKFEFAEQWFIVAGKVDFIDDNDKISKSAQKGEIIKLPKNSSFSQMRFSDQFQVKQYLDDLDERNIRVTNIKINYLIIQTILEITNLFDDFTSPVPHETEWLFECAKLGDLYSYTDSWEMVDQVIQSLVERTGIRENIWYGTRRLRTGIRYTEPECLNRIADLSAGCDKEDKSDFIDIDSITDQLANDSGKVYDRVKDDPMGIYQATDDYVDGLHDLKNLILLYTRSIKKEEEVFLHVFPYDIAENLQQPRNSGKQLNKNGLPHYVHFGTELSEAIKRLIWSTSVGYENRMKLKDL